MIFQPRMTTRIDGFSVIECFHRRYWHGMVADVWNVACAPRAGGYYHGRHPRLFIPLEARAETDGDFKMWEVGHTPIRQCHQRAVSFIPAGMEMQSEVTGIRELRHLDIHFDETALLKRLGKEWAPDLLERPRMLLADPKLVALAQLIAAECESTDPLHQLYGDGLTLALIIGVLKISAEEKRRRSPLAGWQLRRAIEYIEENCLKPIRLQDLAELTGLSESYFSHAFKATTGMPPHRWQMKARIERVKDLMKQTDLPLTVIAGETGFADPAHFSRAFRQVVGITPSEWRRMHCG
ncbi:AraC family transcriptional regulator [Pseudomonas sp. R2.Fl]|nr:AraC family transcriptional regulator [Pseudomonas sp. R2.Fl]